MATDDDAAMTTVYLRASELKCHRLYEIMKIAATKTRASDRAVVFELKHNARVKAVTYPGGRYNKWSDAKIQEINKEIENGQPPSIQFHEMVGRTADIEFFTYDDVQRMKLDKERAYLFNLESEKKTCSSPGESGLKRPGSFEASPSSSSFETSPKKAKFEEN